MKKLFKNIVVLSIMILVLIIGGGCANKDEGKNIFGVKEFTNEMKNKNYEFELKDATKTFLQGTRKRFIIGEEEIQIYLYKNNKAMEKDASRIHKDGSGYTKGNESMQIDWISYPHFYKKGNIIVEYVGENEKILSDLKDIMGGRFAGYGKVL